MKNNDDQYSFVLLVVGGLLALGLLLDGVGHLSEFLYGEWKHISVGALVLVNMLATAWARNDFASDLRKSEKKVEDTIAELKREIFRMENQTDGFRRETEWHKELVNKHWIRCEHTIDKVEKFMDQKTPILVEVPKSPVPLTAHVISNAIDDVIGEC